MAKRKYWKRWCYNWVKVRITFRKQKVQFIFSIYLYTFKKYIRKSWGFHRVFLQNVGLTVSLYICLCIYWRYCFWMAENFGFKFDVRVIFKKEKQPLHFGVKCPTASDWKIPLNVQYIFFNLKTINTESTKVIQPSGFDNIKIVNRNL